MQDTIIEITKNWLEKLIIGMNLCPFAKAPYENNAIRIVVSDARSLTEAMNFFEREIRYLAKHSKIETALLVFAQFVDISAFNMLVQQCEAKIFLKKWYKEYQLAFFHPDASIQGHSVDSPHNLVIQAPYPVLHLLRTPSVENMGAKIKEDVQITNDKKLSQMTKEQVQDLWKEIKETKE